MWGVKFLKYLFALHRCTTASFDGKQQPVTHVCRFRSGIANKSKQDDDDADPLLPSAVVARNHESEDPLRSQSELYWYLSWSLTDDTHFIQHFLSQPWRLVSGQEIWHF